MHVHDEPERKNHRPEQQPTGTTQATGPQALLDLQRLVGNAAVAGMVQRSEVPDVLRSSGRPLDGSVRAEMEASLGADFSDVRVHTDAAARRSAAELGARAYTSGSHVVIGEGGGDRHTLAHELVHVVQQRQGPVAGTDNGSGLSVSDPSDRFEREAERIATHVTHGGTHVMRAPAAGRGGDDQVQRAILWINRTGTDLVQFGQALGDLVDVAAQTVMHNADSVPYPGQNAYIEQWHQAYLEFLRSADTNLLHARFGYAVEALTEAWLRAGRLDSRLPQGYRLGYQVTFGHTRPDVVVYDATGRDVGWFDLTAAASSGHVVKKTGSQWSSRDYVAEALYPSLDVSLLSGSDARAAAAAKRRAKARAEAAERATRINALGTLVTEVYDAMTATSNDDKRLHFETAMGQRVGGAKLAPRAAKSLLSMLEDAGFQRPTVVVGRGKGRQTNETVSWMRAFGYTNVHAIGRNAEQARAFLDQLLADLASTSAA